MAQSRTLAQVKSQRESRKKPSAVPPLVGNQYFRVYFGSTLISFSRVSSVQQSEGHEDLAEGGLNDHIHVLTRVNAQSGTLTFEKGVAADGSVTKIMQSLAPGTRISVPVTITLYGQDSGKWKPVRSWGFDDGMVTRWELGTLEGMGSELAIEKLEISHAGLVELEV
jgi:phage tail-like protein